MRQLNPFEIRIVESIIALSAVKFWEYSAALDGHGRLLYFGTGMLSSQSKLPKSVNDMASQETAITIHHGAILLSCGWEIWITRESAAMRGLPHVTGLRTPLSLKLSLMHPST